MRTNAKGAVGADSGGKLGSGRKGLKRLKVRVLDGSSALNRPSLRRLARRAGVKRISLGIYEEAPAALRAWLSKIIHDACALTEHARRMTVIVNDVLLALKRNGMTLYGFGERAERRRRLVQPLARQDLAAAAQRLALRKNAATPSPIVTAPAIPAQAAHKGPSKRKHTLTAHAQRTAARKPTASPQPMAVPSLEGILPHPAQEKEAVAPTPEEEEEKEVTPERSMHIQQAFAAFRDTVIARQQSSSAEVKRAVEWAAAYLQGQGKVACSVEEAQIVLDALQSKDAVQLEDNGNTVWFL